MSVTPVGIGPLKALVDQLADLGIDPLHLHTDGHTEIRPPDFRLWLRTRTDFERVCDALDLKPKRSRWDPEGQRSYSATKDTDEARLLVQVVSFRHHDDWEES
jgi:hypothetical protein